MTLTMNGVAFTEEFITPVDDLTRFWIPDHVQDGTDVTLVIVNHGWGGGNGHMTSSQILPFTYGCVDRGWVLACGDLHGDTWANPQGMADLANCHEYADSRWNVQHVVMHGLSAGALTSAVALGRGILPNVRGTILIDGVLSQLGFYNPEGSSGASMNAAWGTTDATEYAAATLGHDPVRDPAEWWSDKPIFMAASPNDITVRINPHSNTFYGRLLTPEHVTYTQTSGHHTVEANMLNPQALAWLDARVPPYSGGVEGPPPPVSGSSNLRATDGSPVLLRSTAGNVVSLAPA